MDSTVSGTIYSIVSSNWSYFFTRNPSFVNSSGVGQYVGPVQFMGYSGASLAFFLPCMGAWQAAAKIIKDIEAGMDSFLEEFGGENGSKWKELAEDSEKSQAM